MSKKKENEELGFATCSCFFWSAYEDFFSLSRTELQSSDVDRVFLASTSRKRFASKMFVMIDSLILEIESGPILQHPPIMFAPRHIHS